MSFLILQLVWDYISEDDILNISSNAIIKSDPYLSKRIYRNLEIELKLKWQNGHFKHRILVNGLAWPTLDYKITLHQLREYIVANGNLIKQLKYSNLALGAAVDLHEEVQDEIWSIINTYCINVIDITTYPLDIQALSHYRNCSSLSFSLSLTKPVELPILNCTTLCLRYEEEVFPDEEYQQPFPQFNKFIKGFTFLQTLNISSILNDINDIIVVLRSISTIKTLKNLELDIRFRSLPSTLEKVNYKLKLDSYKLNIRCIESGIEVEEYPFKVALFPADCHTLVLNSKPDALSKIRIAEHLNKRSWHSVSLYYTQFQHTSELLKCKMSYNLLHFIQPTIISLPPTSILSNLVCDEPEKELIINATSKYLYLELYGPLEAAKDCYINFQVNGYSRVSFSCVPFAKKGYKTCLMYYKQ